jgi:hypothetical protein
VLHEGDAIDALLAEHPIPVLLLIPVLVALGGLFAALKPEEFARVCLAKWQRERLAGNMSGLSWTGWIIFGFSLFGIAVMVMLFAFNR